MCVFVGVCVNGNNPVSFGLESFVFSLFLLFSISLLVVLLLVPVKAVEGAIGAWVKLKGGTTKAKNVFVCVCVCAGVD